MKIRKITYYLGRMMFVGAAIMFVPVLVALIYGDGCVPAFLIPSAVVALLAFAAVTVFKKQASSLNSREGMALAALTWIILSVFGALPSMICGAVPSFTDAFFDTVSGYTTTGATVLKSMNALPKSILFWRSFTHWVGGLGILAFAIAVLPQTKTKTGDGAASEAFAIRAESPGPTFGKLVSKLKFNTQILYLIYLGLTVIEAVLLIGGGMPAFDSIVNSMATMGSGGFSMTDAGIAGYGSAYIEWVIGIFMVLAGLNFNFYYFSLIRKFAKAFRMEEVRIYLGIIAVSVAAITVNIHSLYSSLGECVRHAFFQVATVISTTGFSTVNFDLWPEFSKLILVILMFIGGCAGSTGGGIKVSRIAILTKTAIKETRYYINPREVRTIHFDAQPLERSVITGISSFFVVYILIFTASLLLVGLEGHDFTTTFTSVAACLNNIGPGLGKVGPASNFSCMSTLSKYVLSLDMLFGRLELFPLIVLLTPNSWRR